MDNVWQPIATAPKDGTWVDLWVPDNSGGYRIADCWWCAPDECWQQVGFTGAPRFDDPSHWMYRPAPPPPAQ